MVVLAARAAATPCGRFLGRSRLERHGISFLPSLSRALSTAIIVYNGILLLRCRLAGLGNTQSQAKNLAEHRRSRETA